MVGIQKTTRYPIGPAYFHDKNQIKAKTSTCNTSWKYKKTPGSVCSVHENLTNFHIVFQNIETFQQEGFIFTESKNKNLEPKAACNPMMDNLNPIIFSHHTLLL